MLFKYLQIIFQTRGSRAKEMAMMTMAKKYCSKVLLNIEVEFKMEKYCKYFSGTRFCKPNCAWETSCVAEVIVATTEVAV
jgi:hypothetical protein